VVITHWHNDHPQGVSAIRDVWPKARIIATEETKKGMLGPQLQPGPGGAVIGLEPSADNERRLRQLIDERIAAFDKQLADPELTGDRRRQAEKAKRDYLAFVDNYKGTYVVPPTETFAGELTIDDPQVPVKVLFLGRANTAGDAVVWLPKQRTVVTGDIVVWPTPFGFFSFPADWVQTLTKIKALDYATLIPGHGEPQTDTGYIDQLIGSIEDIRGQVGPLAKQGLSLEDVGKKVDFSRYAAIFGTDERRKRLFKAYWTDPMTENAWKEARGVPVVQGEGEVTVAKQAPAARKN
jgi:glyoxylase-like metal-dependent hydrolase (beta-lactamase superfamily II)